MRYLTLFKGGSPNLPDTLYIYADNPTAYRTKVAQYLHSNYQTIVPDTFQISNNNLTLANNSENRGITYIIEFDTEDTDYLRCYFVDDVIERSRLLLFNLSLDIFGTYISKMQYLYFTCERTSVSLFNSHIECGNVLSDGQEVTPLKSTTFDKWSSSLMVVLYVTLKRTDAFSNPSITTLPLAFELSKLKSAFDTAVKGNYSNSNDIPTILSEVLGSITEISGGFLGTEHYQVTINNAYLIPSEFINDIAHSIENSMIITAKTNLVTNPLEIACNTLKTMKKTISLTIPSSISKYKKHYIGTYLSNIEIPLYVNTSLMKAYVNCSISKGALQIEIEYGNATKDITSAFAFVATNNNIEAESLSRISNFIGLIASGATAVGGAMTGNPLAVIGGGASFATSAMGAINAYNQKPPKTNTSTSADINYLWQYGAVADRPLTYPIVIVSYEPEDDIAISTALYGAPCNDVGTDIRQYIINGTPIFPNSKIDFTFVKGRFTDMKGIPKTAVNVIQSAFDGGIKILR